MLRLRAPLLLAGVAVAVWPAVARAVEPEPIMTLAQVQPGMHCQGASVVQGTTIATFDVDVVDIVAGDAAARSPYILFRASGPAVDRTGIGPGFSGSPIRCPDADGVLRIAGAISEGIGEYGGLTALATPIESVLGQPVDVPHGAVHRSALVARARPIAEPLSVGGLSPAVAAAVQAAGRRAGRTVYATPAAPRAGLFPPQPLVPGAAVATGLAAGDVTAGAIGTVTYADGDRVWAFGHPLDAAGTRSLFLQDAYVYDVINQPLAVGEISSYKYAAAGHALGTLTSDGANAVAGRIGPLPPSIPMDLTAKDLDTGHVDKAHVDLADESALGNPAGYSALSAAGSFAVAQLAYTVLQGAPLRQSGRMCVRFTLAELPEPVGFCNTYVGSNGAQDATGGPLVSDFGDAASQLDAFKFGPLHLTAVKVNLALRRDLRQAYLFEADGPAQARPGSRIPVLLHVRPIDGRERTIRVRVRIPRAVKPGRRTLAFAGTAADASGSPLDGLTEVIDLGDLLGDPGGDDAGPRTVDALAASIRDVHRRDGVTARFDRGDAHVVYRSPRGSLRLSGAATLELRIRRR